MCEVSLQTTGLQSPSQAFGIWSVKEKLKLRRSGYGKTFQTGPRSVHDATL